MQLCGDAGVGNRVNGRFDLIVAVALPGDGCWAELLVAAEQAVKRNPGDPTTMPHSEHEEQGLRATGQNLGSSPVAHQWSCSLSATGTEESRWWMAVESVVLRNAPQEDVAACNVDSWRPFDGWLCWGVRVNRSSHLHCTSRHEVRCKSSKKERVAATPFTFM